MGISAAGHVTLGRYELLGKLASGGMGEIFLARLVGQAGFAKLVVLKRLLPELVPAGQFVSMFLDEARLAARLSHPNVCEVHDLGVDDGQYYIVMQYLEGVPFARVMVREPEGDVRAHLRLVGTLLAEACEGLHHAHQLEGDDGRPLGVVHRDVSPSNLFVTADGVLKVLDFGIAKAAGATSVTEKGILKGKFAYMSPEQMAEGAVDRRSDVFCLGILLHEAITNQRLFRRDSPALAARAILEEPISDVRAAAPEVPTALAAVVARALARPPGDRFATAHDCGVALGAALATLGGPMTAAEIAQVIRKRFATDLIRQRAQYRSSAAEAAAGGGPALADADDEELTRPHAGQELSAAPTRARGPAPTMAATVLGHRRPPRRRAAPAIIAGVVVAGLAVGVLAMMRRAADRTPIAAAPTTSDAAPSSTSVPVPDAVSAPDAAPVPVSVPVPVPDAAVPPQPQPPPRVAPARHGFLSIDSTPYGVVFVDGKRLGVTPLIRRKVPAGHHELRIVLKDGRSRTLPVDIPPGAEAAPLQLSW